MLTLTETIIVSFIIIRLTGDAGTAGEDAVEEGIEDAFLAQVFGITVAEDAGATAPTHANLTVAAATEQAVLPFGHLR